MTSPARRTVKGVLAGGGLLVGTMLALAGVAIAAGMVARDPAGRLDLGPWLVLEIVGGAAVSVFAGALSRRIAQSNRGPLVLALCAFTVGLLEAAQLLGYSARAGALAPTWLVLLAPVVTAAGVLLGGLLTAPMRGHRWWRVRDLRLGGSLRWALPALVLVAAAALARTALPSVDGGTEELLVASALTLDLTVVVPGLVLALLVRARRAPWLVLIPTFAVGYAVASAAIPAEQQALLQGMRWLVVPAELCAVGYLVALARRAIASAPGREGDFATRFRAAARQVLGTRIPADILTTEVSILHYALRGRSAAPSSPGTFTLHREAGFLVITIGLIMVLAVETIPVHLFVRQWSSGAAWTLTGLSIYACLWLVGDYRALVARPIRITPSHLAMQVGVRWEAEVPLAAIAFAQPLVRNREAPPREALVAGIESLANLRLRFKEPVEITGMYGIRRTTPEVWLTMDEPDRFCRELRDLVGATPEGSG